MATRVPRINVAFDAETRDAIMECSEASGMSASQLVSTLMQGSLPVIKAMTEAFRAAKTDPSRAVTMLKNLADTATAIGAQTSLELEEARTLVKHRRRKKRA